MKENYAGTRHMPVLNIINVNDIYPEIKEPNKLYEAMFFDTPIIVSPQTYIGKKVKSLNVGFEIDSYDERLVKEVIDAIDDKTYNELRNNVKAINKQVLVTDNSSLVKRIKELQRDEINKKNCCLSLATAQKTILDVKG